MISPPMACWIDILSSGLARGSLTIRDLVRTGAYRQHGGFTGEGILEECAFLGDRREFV